MVLLPRQIFRLLRRKFRLRRQKVGRGVGLKIYLRHARESRELRDFCRSKFPRIHLSGQCGEPTKLKESDAGKQTEQTLQRIDDILKQAGTSNKKIIFANIWLRDPARDVQASNGQKGILLKGILLRSGYFPILSDTF